MSIIPHRPQAWRVAVLIECASAGSRVPSGRSDPGLCFAAEYDDPGGGPEPGWWWARGASHRRAQTPPDLHTASVEVNRPG